MAGLTFDAGVLIAADRGDRRAWTIMKEHARHDQGVASVPAPVLAQVWRRRPSANLARFLQGCHLESMSPELARLAGELCGMAGTSDVVDATLIVSAASRGDTVVTSDPRDLHLLAPHVAGVEIREL